MLNKHPIMIACVTFDTAMIVEPTLYYGARDIHLFSFVRDPDGKDTIYGEFNDEVVRQLRDAIPGGKIMQYTDNPVYELETMIRELSNTVSSIRRYDKESRILINVSAGSKMFSIAGVIVSLRCDNVDFFTVGTREYHVEFEKIVETYYKDGKPVGHTKHCYPPKIFEKLDVMYDDELVIRGLRIFIRFYDKNTSSIRKEVIRTLNDSCLLPENNVLDINNYERHFKEKWLEKGWIEQDPSVSRRYRPTSKGRRMANTFFTN